MRISNLVIAISPLLIAVIFTIITYANIYTIVIAFGLWLAMVVGLYTFINFYIVSLRARSYTLHYLGRLPRLRVASLVLSYNEEPEIVMGTLLSVKDATKGFGDVYLLDDSTREDIREKLEKFCRENGIIYIHRSSRRGFKAGAINDALRIISDKYDIVAIFDADQRPLEGFFELVLPYFEDPEVAIVQIPQGYTEIVSGVAHGARSQQEPFLRVIMRGRNGASAFSLGSGSVFRISALKEVGFFREYSITEDVATTIPILERGYKVIYVDAKLIWYGEPPQDLGAYVTQQSRWSFGYFQIAPSLVKSGLKASVFFDFFAGFLYWLKEGPLTLFELIAPITFLLLGLPILRMDPMLYLLAYIPYMLVSVALFIISVRGRGEYGLKEFYYHQAVEYLAFYAITLSFIRWVLGKKIPFKVTPKGSRKSRNVKLLIPHLIVLLLLLVSIIVGLLRIQHSYDLGYIYSVAINIFWAAYHLIFLAGGIAISTRDM
ncbi:MAG: glycosyltransferase family 2 protein [Sulfolobales archaeon]